MTLEELKDASEINEQGAALAQAIESLTEERHEYRVETIGNSGRTVRFPVAGEELVSWLKSLLADRVAKLKALGVRT